ncbi:DUF1659 domain-containing protein [Heyndrickxia sp. NPDC080065]|uniref:DUF1659 domain-containing protein n=1 Tax=Heyndrickxia sp. NPDC080065 TaxID=3390568 RepID=UPI003D077CDE
MAQLLLKKAGLKLAFDGGVDDKGKPITKVKTFNNVRLEATTDELLQAAQAIGSLSQKNLFGIERIDSSDIRA